MLLSRLLRTFSFSSKIKSQNSLNLAMVESTLVLSSIIASLFFFSSFSSKIKIYIFNTSIHLPSVILLSFFKQFSLSVLWSVISSLSLLIVFWDSWNLVRRSLLSADTFNHFCLKSSFCLTSFSLAIWYCSIIWFSLFYFFCIFLRSCFRGL